MTTTMLIDMASGYRWFLDNKVQVLPGEVMAAGSLAQSELCSTLEILEGRSYIDLVAGQAEYTLPESVIRIKGERLLYVNGQTTYPIAKRTSDEMELLSDFAADNMRLYYTREETNVVIGFKGIPSASGGKVYYRYHRKPLSSEALSATQNPILSSVYDMQLYWYTMKQLVEIYKDVQGGDRKLVQVEQICASKRADALAIKLRRGFTAESDYTSLRF